jgi:hypothetical protein
MYVCTLLWTVGVAGRQMERVGKRFSPASADSLWVSPDTNRVHSKFSTIPLSTLYIKVWNLVLRYQHGYIDTRLVVLASRSSHLPMATRRDLGVIY